MVAFAVGSTYENDDHYSSVSSPTPASKKTTIISTDHSEISKEEEEWQRCEIFLAPTSNQMGWGVFAGRNFEIGDIVELSSGFIPMSVESSQLHASILHDHVYGYYRIQFPTSSYSQQQQPEIQQLHAVILGMGMFYNHHPTSPNVQYQTFSREPAPDVPGTSQSIGYIARRNIQAGEQLFSHYGDESQFWFTERQIELSSMKDPGNIPSQDLAKYKSDYCSKLYSGPGLPVWKNRILPILPSDDTSQLPFSLISHERLPPFDGGYAKAKTYIKSGETMELSTGMIVSQKLMTNTSLGAIVIRFQDLDLQNQGTLRKLRDENKLIVQYQGEDTNWKRVDQFQSMEDVAILPASGNGGTIRRRRESEITNNCKLVIQSTMLDDTLGVTLEWIATTNIEVGQIITVNLPKGGTAHERQLLEEERRLTGQMHYFDNSSNKDSSDTTTASSSSTATSITIKGDEL